MRSVFTSGHYTYTRHYADSNDFSEYYSWAKNATKTFALPAPYTGTEYIEGESQIIVEAWIGEGEPDQAIYYYGNENRILIGQGMFIPGATPVGENFTFSYDPSNNRVSVTAKYAINQACGVYISVKGFSTSEVSVKVADDYKLNAVLDAMPSTVSDGTHLYNVIQANRCYYGCSNLQAAPTLSENLTKMTSCFEGCVSLVQAPEIPNSVNESNFPINSLFYGCRALEGNVVFDFDEGQMMSETFRGTTKDIFIVNKGSYDVDLKSVAQAYSNVHFEADDNPIPAISNFTATRVSAVGSTTFDATGLYAHVQARLMAYDSLIPVGWTNEVKSIVLKDNGVVESPTWQPVITDYPADVYCWIYLGDTSTHNLSLQITDSIKEDNVEVKSQTSIEAITTISKSYALVDYYHDDVTDTEGMAIGKYAEYADLLDIDMPTRHRQAVQCDDDVSIGEKLTVTEQTSTENLLLQLDTSGASGTVDDDIYADLVTLGWDTDVIV